MLNWICPECGRENDPNLADCPGCLDPQPVVRRRKATSSPPKRVLAGRVPWVLPAGGAEPLDPEPATEPLPTRLEPALPAVATELSAHTARLDRAARVPNAIPQPADPGHGTALASMLGAMIAAPEPLTPGVSVVATPPEVDEVAETPKELCARVPMPAPKMVARFGPIVIRQHVKPDEYAAPPTTVPKTPAVAAAHDLLYCEQILAGRPPRPSGAEPFRPSPPRSLARNRRRLQLPSSCRIGDTLAPANLCGAVEVPKPVFHLRPMASMPLTAAAPAANPFRDPALPSALRHFQEAVVPRVAYLKRPGGETPAAAAAATDRRGLPGWAITIGTALGVLLVALFAVQRFTARADVHAASAPGAVATTPAAYGAWPSIDKYVEVAGVRITTDQKQNSEAVFSVVNHSSADIGAMAIKLTVPSAKAGDPPVCDMTANVEGLGPWEAREVRVQLTREVQASEMPEWRDMRPRVSITSPQ